ncbi:CPBP family intramembrane glutamic endopeptidase [Parablastomonas sp. CN1-191]|uniref:CPBP family intramembrane glutamic endopeptidase n=1 Tax=Parablastomonas sp. CN1-191 TaxID=3400908 RepID=UPI003BF83EA3
MSAPDRKPLWLRIVDFPLITLVLVLLAVALPLRVVGWAAAMVLPAGDHGWPYFLVRGLLQPLVAVLVYRAVTTRIGIDRHQALPFSRRSLDALRGSELGFLLMSTIVAIAALLGGYRIAGWGHLGSWRDLILVAGTGAAVIEEIIARGILFRYIEDLAGTWAALVLSAALFGLGHALNPAATWFSTIAIAVEAGVLLGGAYMLTRDLWLAMGIHFGWNVTQGLVWDVPVSGFAADGLVDAHAAGSELISGGAFGLEASVVALVCAGAAGTALVIAATRRGHVRAPLWSRRRT